MLKTQLEPSANIPVGMTNKVDLSPFTVTIKLGLKKHKKRLSLAELPDRFKRIWAGDFNVGDQGLYVCQRIKDANGKGGYWPILDVESENHDDIRENIAAAKQVMLVLTDHRIDTGVKVMASGRGFRFAWPFLIPHEYAGAFRVFVKRLPYVENMKDRGFMRLLCYRGNSQQDKLYPPPDVHTHMLQDPKDLQSMGVDEYKSLVSGRLSHDIAARWLSELMPRQQLPDQWGKVLDEYRKYSRLNRGLLTLPKIRRVGNADILKQAFSCLDTLGIEYTEYKSGGRDIWKLSECPRCGRRDRAQWITAKGRLKCFHESCEAGQRNEQGGFIGLSPNQWIPNYDAPIDVFDGGQSGKSVTKEQAWEIIAEAIRIPGDDKIINVTPGGGKTYTTLKELAPFCQERTIVYAVPTLDKAREIVEKDIPSMLPEIWQGVNVNWIRGRTGGTPQEDYMDQNCDRAAECDRVSAKGFKPGIIVCPKCIKKRKEKKEDPCAYWQQFGALKNPGLIVTSHEQAVYPHERADDIIFDEDPTDAVFKSENLTQGEVMRFTWGGGDIVSGAFTKMEKAAQYVFESAQEEKKSYGILYSERPPKSVKKETSVFWEDAGISAEEKQAISDHLAAYDQWLDETYAAHQRRLYHDNVNMRALDWWHTALAQKKGWAAIEVHTRKKDPLVFSFQYLREINVSGRIIILDGTAHKGAMDVLFNRDFEQVDATVTMPDTKTVLICRALGKNKFKGEKGITDKGIRQILDKAWDEIPRDAQKILIGTHKDVEDRIKEIAVDVFQSQRVDMVHFKGNRGLNRYTDHDAYIAFGAITINPLAAWKQASLFFADKENREEYRAHLSISENLQTAHRIRPVNGGKTIVVVSRDWIPGLPSWQVFRDLRRGEPAKMEEAFSRLAAFYEKTKFVYRDIAPILKVGYAEEREKLDDWDEKPVKNFTHYLIKDIYDNAVRKCKVFGLDKVIVIGHWTWWDRLLERLKKAFPDAADLVTTQTESGKKNKGIGTVEAARAFFTDIKTETRMDLRKWLDTTLPEREVVSCDDPSVLVPTYVSGKIPTPYLTGGLVRVDSITDGNADRLIDVFS